MYLKKVALNRFRSFVNSCVEFHEDLTVLVGENNGGKSNVIDSLRLLIPPLSERRDRYCEFDDLYRGATDTSYEVDGTFAGLTPAQKGLLVSAIIDPLSDTARIGFTAETNQRPLRPQFWGGKLKGRLEQGSRDLIRHVYLPPLRDANRALSSGSASRIHALINHFLGEGQEAEFLDSAKRKSSHSVLESISKAVSKNLGDISGGAKKHVASLDFQDNETLWDLSRDLRFKLAESDLSPSSLDQCGLGYANLLFMATVIVELAKSRQADLTLFLVEEPEAHLHPQLQYLVLDFLLEQVRKSKMRDPEPGDPDGRIQVIATSHSPNITASIDPNHLTVIHSSANPDTGQRKSQSVSIASLKLKPKVLSKVSRYLDVTRSAVLFGQCAILVEGVAEVILLPVLASAIVLYGDPKAIKRFKGISLVPIDGVDFAPYVQVMLGRINDVCIASRLIALTDGDPTVEGDRKAKLEELARSLESENNLFVFQNEITLEHALYSSTNESVLKKAFLSIHTRSKGDWEAKIERETPEKRAAAFVSLLDQKKTRKGALAQAIAEQIIEGTRFECPVYIEQAIKAATSEPE